MHREYFKRVCVCFYLFTIAHNKELGPFQTVYIQVAASHLKTPHVSRVPGILQAVLVALQEKFEEEPTHAEREAKKKEIMSLSIAVCH